MGYTKNARLLNGISDDALYQDFLFNLYLQHEISEGLEDIKNCNTYSIEEIKQIINNYK